LLTRFHSYTPKEREIKETASSASFLDIYIKFDTNGQLPNRLFDKRDDFNFTIINFPRLHSNIRNIKYYQSLYSDFLQRHHILS
jgi:hypothetical protein